MSTLKKIQMWYSLHCDGDWEHSCGISIDTMDNPGWSLKIDLQGTLLETVNFSPIEIGTPENYSSSERYRDIDSENWLQCYRDDEFFYGYCSASNLEQILNIFLEWAEKNTNTNPWDDEVANMFALCNEKFFSSSNVDSVRQLYRDIEDIPNEHPKKKQLFIEFYRYWNELSKKM